VDCLYLSLTFKDNSFFEVLHPAVVMPLNPEGMGIRVGEWVILFSENFEGMGMRMGMGMGNSKKLCA